MCHAILGSQLSSSCLVADFLSVGGQILGLLSGRLMLLGCWHALELNLGGKVHPAWGMQVYSRCEKLEAGAQGATAAGDVAMDEDTNAPSVAEVQEQQVRMPYNYP